MWLIVIICLAIWAFNVDPGARWKKQAFAKCEAQSYLVPGLNGPDPATRFAAQSNQQVVIASCMAGEGYEQIVFKADGRSCTESEACYLDAWDRFHVWWDRHGLRWPGASASGLRRS
jgi:hypothetical protein